MTVEYSYNS